MWIWNCLAEKHMGYHQQTDSHGKNSTITPNTVASCFLNNGKLKNLDKNFTIMLTINWKIGIEFSICRPRPLRLLTTEELMSAIKTLKAGKAPSSDNLHPEFFLHLDHPCLEWVWKLLLYSLQSNKLPKIWKIAKVVAVLKPNKPADAPGSYCPISLLCVAYKLFEKLV